MDFSKHYFSFYRLVFPIYFKIFFSISKLIHGIYWQYCKYKLNYTHLYRSAFSIYFKRKLWTWDLLKKFLFFIKQSRYIWNMNFFYSVLVSVYLKKKNHFLYILETKNKIKDFIEFPLSPVTPLKFIYWFIIQSPIIFFYVISFQFKTERKQ